MRNLSKITFAAMLSSASSALPAQTASDARQFIKLAIEGRGNVSEPYDATNRLAYVNPTRVDRVEVSDCGTRLHFGGWRGYGPAILSIDWSRSSSELSRHSSSVIIILGSVTNSTPQSGLEPQPFIWLDLGTAEMAARVLRAFSTVQTACDSTRGLGF